MKHERLSAQPGSEDRREEGGKTVFIERGRFGDNPERNGKQADRLEQYGTHDTPELTGLGKRIVLRYVWNNKEPTTLPSKETRTN